MTRLSLALALLPSNLSEKLGPPRPAQFTDHWGRSVKQTTNIKQRWETDTRIKHWLWISTSYWVSKTQEKNQKTTAPFREPPSREQDQRTPPVSETQGCPLPHHSRSPSNFNTQGQAWMLHKLLWEMLIKPINYVTKQDSSLLQCETVEVGFFFFFSSQKNHF